jgi:hypothetical protein
MADNNNALAASLTERPHPELAKLDRLVGTWQVSGQTVHGQVRFEWLAGGFFLVQDVDLTHGERHIKGVEYIGYDQDTGTLRSHFMDNFGSNFAYTWAVDGDGLWVWFGDKGSANVLHAAFSADGDEYAGRWQWPMGDGTLGGYDATMTRVVAGRPQGQPAPGTVAAATST